MRRGWLAGAALAGSAAGGAAVKKLWLDKYREQASALAGARRERDLLYTWLLLEGKGAGAEEYFLSHGIRSVAVLGMNPIGRRFIDTLQKRGDVTAAYGVELDNPGAVHETLTVYRLGDDPLPAADCMVICDLERVSEKREQAQTEFPGTVVTLTELFSWLLEKHGIAPRDGAIEGWPFDA